MSKPQYYKRKYVNRLTDISSQLGIAIFNNFTKYLLVFKLKNIYMFNMAFVKNDNKTINIYYFLINHTILTCCVALSL